MRFVFDANGCSTQARCPDLFEVGFECQVKNQGSP